MTESLPTDAAVEIYRQTVAQHPDDALALFNLGTLLAQQSKLDEALPYLQQATVHSSAWAVAHYNLGTVFLRLNRYREAIAAFEQAITHSDTYPEAQFNCGNAHALIALQGEGSLDYYELDCAITAYKIAIQQRPGYTAALYNLGMLYKRRNSAEGVQVWERYLEASQNMAEESTWRLRATEYKRALQNNLG